MITCPLCEHQQEFGLECEQCGKDLGTLDDLGPPPTSAEPLEGLEVRDTVGAVNTEPLPELERTVFEPVEVSPDQTPEIEATAVDGVGDVAVEPVPDLSLDRAQDTDPRTQLDQRTVTCRYCRQVQRPQALCEVCGMSLPRRVEPTLRPSAKGRAEDVTTRCRACGAPAKAGQRCGDCGREVPYP